MKEGSFAIEETCSRFARSTKERKYCQVGWKRKWKASRRMGALGYFKWGSGIGLLLRERLLRPIFRGVRVFLLREHLGPLCNGERMGGGCRLRQFLDR